MNTSLAPRGLSPSMTSLSTRGDAQTPEAITSPGRPLTSARVTSSTKRGLTPAWSMDSGAAVPAIAQMEATTELDGDLIRRRESDLSGRVALASRPGYDRKISEAAPGVLEEEKQPADKAEHQPWRPAPAGRVVLLSGSSRSSASRSPSQALVSSGSRNLSEDNQQQYPSRSLHLPISYAGSHTTPSETGTPV